MRALLFVALVGLLSAGCSKGPTPDPKKNPPRRMMKPGEGGMPKPQSP